MGGIIWPIMLAELRKLMSFANAIRATAALTGVLLLIANFAMKASHSRKYHLPKPDFKIIFRDEAYLISIAAAFCIGLGLFFPCAFLVV
jgi:MFS transporter, MCT family, solute carrier family 16 (monocarboxylic acid transporters), member 10